MHDRSTVAEQEEGRSFASGRYVCQRVLGEGGQKVVYLVHDAALDRECALALLKADQLSPEALQRLQREARTMARLDASPHVVGVYDYGEENGAPYLVSEYVRGGDLRREIRTNPSGMPIERVLGIAADIADALAAAHASGIVHRDVTPGNVWLAEDGRSKLGDFGLAVGGEGAISAEGGLVGTAAYMAPEQALGQRCDAKSDLYSLGVVMYEMATGRQPFAGDDPLAVVSQHINTAPVAPSWHNPAIQPALDALILSLLAKVPEDRPASGAAVCEALVALRAAATEDTTVPTALNPLERLAGGVFVGREAELATLRSTVESAIGGKPQVFLIAGEPGIGKTRLSEQLATYAKLRRATVYWGRCQEGYGAPAFWPWTQILRARAAALDDDVLRAEIGEDGARIAQILPELGTRLGIEAARASTPEQARFELFEAIAAWLRRSAQRAPLLVLLEDLHWADEPSVLLLRFLAESLRETPVVLAGTYRDAEIIEPHPLARFLTGLPRLASAHLMTLRGLSEADVGSYIELATGKQAPPRLAATVHRQTEGNALFVSEVVRMLTASGAIDAAEASWTQEIPSGVRGVIGRRLSGLSAVCRGVLTAASVIGREFELRILERVSDVGLEAVLDALDEAMTAQLVSLAPETSRRQGRYVFSHALVRDTLYDELGSGLRMKIHARTGAVLEDLYGSDPGQRLGAMAHHFRESAAIGDVSKAIDYSIRAGDAARRVFAYEETVRHWDAAIELLGDENRPKEQAKLLQRASDVMFVSGVGYARGIEYAEQGLNVLTRIGDRDEQALAHFRLGRLFTTYQEVVDLPRATTHLETSVKILSADPRSPILGYAHTGLAAVHDRALCTEDGLKSAQTAREIAEDLHHDPLLALAMDLEGTFLMKQGRLREGTTMQDHAWDLADRIEDALVGFYCAWDRAYRRLFYLGDPRGAIRILQRELSKPRMKEAVVQRRQLNKHMAQAHLECGQLGSLGEPDEVEPADLGYLSAEGEGKWQQLLDDMLAMGLHSNDVGNRLQEGEAARMAGIAFGNAGRGNESAQSLGRSLNLFEGNDVAAALRARALLCIAEANRGNRDDAREHLARCDEVVAQGEEWLGQTGRIELARAATLACSDDLTAGEVVFGRAIEILRRYELVWDEAEAFRLWGRALSGSGNSARAMDKFRQAIDIYRGIGAGAPWIARIVQEYGGSESTVDVTLGA